MPRTSKTKHTNKQKRQAKHIEASEKKEGKSPSAATRIAWATVNKESRPATKSSHKVTHH